jgi:hypothetical protein
MSRVQVLPRLTKQEIEMFFTVAVRLQNENVDITFQPSAMEEKNPV